MTDFLTLSYTSTSKITALPFHLPEACKGFPLREERNHPVPAIKGSTPPPPPWGYALTKISILF